ncbi:hypothetical protein [Planomonospora parontospora]|nr:hypothetical protein [Planomonospora parontospora]
MAELIAELLDRREIPKYLLGRENSVWRLRVHRRALGHEEFTPHIISFTLLKLQFWPEPVG